MSSMSNKTISLALGGIVVCLSVCGCGGVVQADAAEDVLGVGEFGLVLPEDEFFWGRRGLFDGDSMSLSMSMPTTPTPPPVVTPTTPPEPTPTPPPVSPPSPTAPPPTPGAVTPTVAPPTEPAPTEAPPTGQAPTESSPTEAPPTTDGGEEGQTIATILANDRRFDTLAGLVTDFGLLPSLEGEGPVTVFAPTNEAFATINIRDPNAIMDVLMYHVVGEEVLLEDGKSVMTLNGDSVVLTVTDTETKVNDSNIIETIEASNGIIYVIDGVLLPPTKRRSRRLLRSMFNNN